MTAADHPRAYHRRIDEQLDEQGRVPTLCGRVVHYQQANGSLTNVDCPECIGAADSLVNDFVVSIKKEFGPVIERLRRSRSS